MVLRPTLRTDTYALCKTIYADQIGVDSSFRRVVLTALSLAINAIIFHISWYARTLTVNILFSSTLCNPELVDFDLPFVEATKRLEGKLHVIQHP